MIPVCISGWDRKPRPISIFAGLADCARRSRPCPPTKSSPLKKEPGPPRARNPTNTEPARLATFADIPKKSESLRQIKRFNTLSRHHFLRHDTVAFWSSPDPRQFSALHNCVSKNWTNRLVHHDLAASGGCTHREFKICLRGGAPRQRESETFMYQPEAYAIALIFMVGSMLCWGSW